MKRKPIGVIVVWICDGMEYVQGRNDRPGAPPNCLIWVELYDKDGPIMFPTRADSPAAVRLPRVDAAPVNWTRTAPDVWVAEVKRVEPE